MLHRITVVKTLIIFGTVILMMLMVSLADCKAIIKSNDVQVEDENIDNFNTSKRQYLFPGEVRQETSAPDFIRLVIMRFIYGLATTVGAEERLEGLFNGAFVPPNADSDIFGFGGFDDEPADTGAFDTAVLEGLFDDDAF